MVTIADPLFHSAAGRHQRPPLPLRWVSASSGHLLLPAADRLLSSRSPVIAAISPHAAAAQAVGLDGGVPAALGFIELPGSRFIC
ncbi:MAG: hypothetical protein U0531_09115 [Dehalococcoidia bacterium]